MTSIRSIYLHFDKTAVKLILHSILNTLLHISIPLVACQHVLKKLIVLPYNNASAPFAKWTKEFLYSVGIKLMSTLLPGFSSV